MSYDNFKTTDATGHKSSSETVSETSAPTVAKPSTYRRLGDLFVSAGNVRTGKPVGIESLAAMIDEQGLLNALHISQELDANGVPTGRWGVEAGGRRYLALMLRVAQGKRSLDDLIECKEVEAGKEKEVSLAENLGQVAMHPTDQFAAFQALVDQGHSVEAIAAKFGEGVLLVKRRLKLANVAPKLLDCYRAGEMTLEAIMAFASVDDQERQIQTWEGLTPYNRNASTIKARLSCDEVAEDDIRVKVVGLDKYIAAGGTFNVDLFSEDSEKTLSDLGLLEMLVGEAIQAQVDVVTLEGWAWVQSFSEYGYDEQRMFTQLPKQYSDETPEQTAQREELEAKVIKLQDELEAIEEDETKTWEEGQVVEKQIDEVEGQLEALQESRIDVSAIDKEQFGAVVALTDTGIVVHRGMSERSAKSSALGNASAAAQTKAPKAEFPEKLMQDLTSHRTAAIQATMLDNQRVSLAALAHTLALSSFDYSGIESPLKVSLRQCRGDLERNSNTFVDSKAAGLLDAAKEKWKAALPKAKAQWFDWFLDQPQELILEFIVYATANSVNTMTGMMRQDTGTTLLANALNLDMTDWWRATPETYFDLVPKSKLAAIVREVGTEAEAVALEKMKKVEAIAQAVSSTEYKKWLPLPLRSAPVVVEQTPEDDEDFDPEE